MTTLTRSGAPDTTNCDKEPIHIPGSVQGYGVLLATAEADWVITHVSGSVASILRKKPDQLLGRNLDDLLGRANVEALLSSQQRAHDALAGIGRLLGARIKGVKGHFNLALHTYMGQRILEIEPVEADVAVPPLDLVGGILTRLKQARSIIELCADTAHEVRGLIGYDRVVVYRFLQDQSGQVIAESNNGTLETLIGLRYPASDIPRQARDLYRRGWIRLIADVQAPPSPILCAPNASSHLDLSHADLRSVSPVHIQYLKNMGVGASMSISIIVGGELWGLIACHHRTSRRVPANLRAAAELLGQVFSLQIQTVEGTEAYLSMRAARALLDRIVTEFPLDGELIDNLAKRLEQLGSFIPCEGAGVLVEGAWRSWRAAPDDDEARAFAQFCDDRRDGGVFASERLRDEYAPARTWRCMACGVLAIPLSHTQSDWLFFFRKELPHVVTWAGDPQKTVTETADGNGLSPRTSFAAWKQNVRGQSAAWTSRQKLIAETLRVYLLEIIMRFSEIIREERRQAEQRQRLVNTQLNQRVKGTLELIQSLVHLGYDAEPQVRDFVRTLEGRIRALSLAHDAISTDNGAQLRSLIETAIAPHTSPEMTIRLTGPEVMLNAKACSVLALVLHELAATSAHAGALSQARSAINVRWQLDGADGLMILWEESHALAACAPDNALRRLDIIRRNIPHALGGSTEVDWRPNGLTAMFVIPQGFVLQRPAAARLLDQQHFLPQSERELANSHVLVYQTNLPAALDLERLLLDHGAAQVSAFGNASSALAAIARSPPDVALLDVDTSDTGVFEVADVLESSGIPFVFTGSTHALEQVPQRHGNAVAVARPFATSAVVTALRDALLPSLIRNVLTKLV